MSKTENKSGTKFIETHSLIDFLASEALHTPLIETDKLRTLLLNLIGGQKSPLCKMSVDVLYYVIEGEGELLVEDEQYTLRAGSMITVPAETTRLISADVSMRVLGVQVL